MKAEFESFAEPRVDRRKILLGALFGGAAVVAAWRKPTVKIDYLGKHKLEEIVPKTIGPWKFVAASGLVIPPEDQLRSVIYSQMLTRVYSDGQNPPIMLLIAQSGTQTGFLGIHRPEICYTASGYEIDAVSPHPIKAGSRTVSAVNMEASLQGATEHIIYWTRIGSMLPLSWREQKWDVAEQNLRGIVPDAILVRVSSVGDNAAAARATIDNFVRALLQAVPADRRAVLIGT